MSSIKWYKRFPSEALQGMMILSLEERGAYNTILDLIYAHDGNLVDDDKFICGWLRCDLRVWKRLKARLVELGKIELRNGLISNLRATSVIDEALSTLASVSELNRIKGIKSGIARKNNKDLGEPEANRGATELELRTRKKEGKPVLKEERELEFFVSENSPEWAIWKKHRGVLNARDIRLPDGKIVRGSYFKTPLPDNVVKFSAA